jgi:sporulation protein YlmC with PRC-barrel domain
MVSEDLKGKEVVEANGYKIGKSKDIVIGSDWKVTHVDVELKAEIEEELGMSSMPLLHNHIPVPVSKVAGVADFITLKITKEQLVDEITAYSKVPEMEP